MKFATKLMQHYPPHLRYVVTLPWDIKKSNFENRLRLDKVTESLKVGTFFETQCISLLLFWNKAKF